MVIINKVRVKGIQVQVKDTLTNKSKSFTVHGISWLKLFHCLLHYAERLAQYKRVKLVCYKEGDEIGKEKTIK